MKKITREIYQKYLNELSPAYDSDEWIIGGKRRYALAAKQKYGTALRRHGPIEFEVGFNEWARTKR